MRILFYDSKVMFSFLFTTANGNRTLTITKVISKSKVNKRMK